MTDEQIANIARQLAEALMLFAHDRDHASLQPVISLAAGLCRARRQELRVPEEPKPWARISNNTDRPDKPAEAKDTSGSQTSRERLPNRRRSEFFEFYSMDLNFTASVSRYADGRPGEIFLDASKAGSAIDTLARDLAITASIALQHNASLEEIRTAFCRDSQNQPLGPLAAALDLIGNGAA